MASGFTVLIVYFTYTLIDSVSGGDMSVLVHGAPLLFCVLVIYALLLLIPVGLALAYACIVLPLAALCTAPLAVSYFTIEAAQDRPKFVFRTHDDWSKNRDGPFAHVLFTFVKGLFSTMRNGLLRRRAHVVTRKVRRRPALLCNIFLWVFIFLFPFLVQ